MPLHPPSLRGHPARLSWPLSDPPSIPLPAWGAGPNVPPKMQSFGPVWQQVTRTALGTGSVLSLLPGGGNMCWAQSRHVDRGVCRGSMGRWPQGVRGAMPGTALPASAEPCPGSDRSCLGASPQGLLHVLLPKEGVRQPPSCPAASKAEFPAAARTPELAGQQTSKMTFCSDSPQSPSAVLPPEHGSQQGESRRAASSRLPVVGWALMQL